MKDGEIRGIVLQEFYDKRREGMHSWSATRVAELEKTYGFDFLDLFRACDQLDEHNLVHWKGIRRQGQTVGGIGKITAFGTDVVEGTKEAPISVEIHHHQSVNVQGSSNLVQIGNNNSQEVTTTTVGDLITTMNNAAATPQQKEEAKGVIAKAFSSETVGSVLGALAKGVADSFLKP